MRLAKVTQNGAVGLAVDTGAGVKALFGDAALYDLDALIASGGSALTDAGAKVSAEGEEVQVEDLTFLPPLVKAPKILCLGLNYKDHAAEGGFTVPEFPTVFGRFNSSLIGHGAPIIKPPCSDQLDYEAEMVAVVGKGGKDISKDDALSHIVAYSVFNDGSIRELRILKAKIGRLGPDDPETPEIVPQGKRDNLPHGWIATEQGNAVQGNVSRGRIHLVDAGQDQLQRRPLGPHDQIDAACVALEAIAQLGGYRQQHDEHGNGQ